MNTRNLILIIIAVAVILAGGYWAFQKESVDVPQDSIEQSGDRIGTTTTSGTEGKLKVANFSGKLSEVNTACFADGECFVVIGGKHITTTLGWRQEVVGSIQGVESIGDMEKHIGEEFEVYAQDKGDGTYTLYGSEGFYIKLK